MTTIELPATIIDERQARIFFSIVAEPGDRQVAAFIASLEKQAAQRDENVWMLAAQLVLGRAIITDDHEIATAFERWTPRARHDDVTRILAQCLRFGIHAVIPGDPHWPTEKLARLGDHAPWVLYARGDSSLLVDEHSIALVGARAATGYGEHVAMEFSAGLVDRGFTIISGAAYGIDGMAHRAALASKGRTIAVLAGGADRFYPSGHDALLTRITESGLVLSEVPPGVPPTKWRFLQRNRLIAALSDALVVLEAGWRSGSLNAAGHAIELGVPLGAVPGPITSAASAGTHRLIRDYGAVCVVNADEAAELAAMTDSPEPSSLTAVPSLADETRSVG